jgi:hypothetical protein
MSVSINERMAAYMQRNSIQLNIFDPLCIFSIDAFL